MSHAVRSSCVTSPNDRMSRVDTIRIVRAAASSSGSGNRSVHGVRELVDPRPHGTLRLSPALDVRRHREVAFVRRLDDGGELGIRWGPAPPPS